MLEADRPVATRVALVHEWLVGWGGSESVLESLAAVFPDAPIYTLVHHPDERVRATFKGRDIRTTFLQGLPFGRTFYRHTLPLMPRAWASLDLDDFDLVFSSSHALCKGVKVRRDALHLCYCHTPPRYLWDLNTSYRRGVASLLAGPLLRWLREKDLAGARGVDRFIANSHYVAERIQRAYGRPAEVIHPPVDVDAFKPSAVGAYYLAGGRLVSYKRVDLAVAAANAGGFPLKVFGDGPERRRLEALAGSTVEFIGAVGQRRLAELVSGCRAYLFPGIEDFGILPVEVQAGGRPVVARAAGGAMETVLDGETGILYQGDSADALLEAISRLEALQCRPAACRAQAAKFGRERFEAGITAAVRSLQAG